MRDRLDEAIQETRRQLNEEMAQQAEWTRRVELTGVRLKALEQAAQLRPSSHGASTSKADGGIAGSSTPASRGRQPGAISKKWRNILLETAAKFPDYAEDAAIVEVARAAGLVNIRLKDVHDRMSSFEHHGYVEPAQTGWRVTRVALAKFGSDQDQTDSDPDQADDEMEAADAA